MRPPLPVPQGGHSATHVPHHRLGSGMGQAGGSLKGSTAAPMHPTCPPSQAPCKAQSFAEEFKWPLVPGCSQGWERGSKEAHTEGRGGEIPRYCKWVVWRATRGELASMRTQLKGPAGASPFLISLKCSRTEPSP